jgi:Uma2 family endonuclease
VENVMATDTVLVERPSLVVPEAVLPNVEHLVTEDETPVDNIFSEKQQRLLTEPLYSSPGWATAGRSFVALANVGLYYGIRRPPYVPDMMLSLDVELPADLWPKSHRCYFVWEFGKPPDMIVEIVSNDEGDEDAGKLAGYARIGVRYYVIHDPQQILSQEITRGFELHATGYRPMPQPLRFPTFGLGLELWQGRYENHENTWLRWTSLRGELIPTGAEAIESERERTAMERQRAEAERQRAEAERQRAETERQRAERLVEQLRRLGAQPET